MEEAPVLERTVQSAQEWQNDIDQKPYFESSDPQRMRAGELKHAMAWLPTGSIGAPSI